uniref:Secreted protein n=1 Tax=Strongyloides papillosus TaxID=174720 RepID=A0A0N5BPC1_STREA
MFNFNIILVFSVLGINFTVSELTAQEATEIVSKLLQPLFEGYHDGLVDTSFSNSPTDLTNNGYTLKPVKMAIIPPDFDLLLNGGKYSCLGQELRKVCNFNGVFTFHDSTEKDTYISNYYLERDTVRPESRTENKLIGYFISANSNGPCGASVNVTRVQATNKVSNTVDRTIAIPEDVTFYQNQNTNNPNTYAHTFTKFAFAWPSENRDINTSIDTYNNRYTQTIDGQPIVRDLDCSNYFSTTATTESPC